MKTPALAIPQAIHHSGQFQQPDLGDTVYLFDGEGPGAETILGEIYNAEDFPCLEEERTEEIEEIALAFADKLVLSYKCHDALLTACKAYEAFDEHASNCANCDEWGPGNCQEGARIYSDAHRLNRAALDKAKPKTKGGSDASS
jgi:hypothetical protein